MTVIEILKNFPIPIEDGVCESCRNIDICDKILPGFNKPNTCGGPFAKHNKDMEKFNVLLWDFNRDELEYFDVLPYLRDRYEERKKRSKEFENDKELSKYWKVPETLDEFKEFIKNESMYQFWARCEYEMICHGWPVRKNDHKLDVHEQIMMNLDVIARIMYGQLPTNEFVGLPVG